MRRQLSLIVFFLFLPTAAVVEGVVADSLNLGFLIPLTGTDGLGQRTAAGIPIGLEAAQKLLPNVRLNWTYVDSRCDESDAPDSVIQLQRSFSNNNMHAVFGESCSDACEVAGFVADAINAPFLSSGCLSDRLGERSVYKAFARSVPPASAFAPVIRAVFEQFNWHSVPIVVMTNGHAFQKLAKLIVKDFQLNTMSSKLVPRIPLFEKISHLFPNDSRYVGAVNSFVAEANTKEYSHGKRLNCNML